MSEDSDPTAVLSLLDDEHARAILAAASTEPMSASELSEACEASTATVYRRIDDLTDHGLLEESINVRADGNHHRVYRATFRRFTLELEDGEFGTEVEVQSEDVADRFTRMWEGL
ncbi:ArsR/SmtB family transcription factor [Halobacterium yunchengense]|uniref:ArsR/SmtB family transcription factor n=1 Tax=Halobacterium yunchengense TaxID=3108497 RepID=UPI00300B633D